MMNVKEKVHKNYVPWLDPEESHLEDPRFEKIWSVIKRWDINVPYAYEGYCEATGNHVRAILDGLDGKSNGLNKHPSTDIFTFMIENDIGEIQVSSMEDPWRQQLEGKKGTIEFGEYVFQVSTSPDTLITVKRWYDPTLLKS